MIKFIVHIAKVIITAVAAVLFSSCAFSQKKMEGSGKVVTQNRELGSFSAIHASNGLEVYIGQGTSQSVTVEADDNLQQHIKTEVKGDELTISSDVQIRNAASKKITVILPQIKGLSSSSGALVKTNTVLKSDAIEISASSGSNLEAAIDGGTVNCDASSGSAIKLSGNAEKLETEGSRGSNVDAARLVAKEVRVDASSGSTITVNPIESLNAEASSGSAVNYVKTPNQIDKHTSSGGSVSQQ